MRFLNKGMPFYIYLPVILACLLFPACTSKKKLIYFNTSEAISGSEANKSYNPVLKTDDILSITVLGLDPDAIKPFNIPVTNTSQNMGGYTQGTPSQPGYLIDEEGNVDFPVVGKIKLAGLSRGVAIDTIKNRLKPYLTQSTLLIRILNYKVTVLGEVRNPGTFTIPNERITLPEALGIAGDLLITGVRKNVLVIRDVEGKKTETRVDLTSKALFSSPVYYLSQNDVVYVEPNRAKINSSVVNTGNISLVVSIVSLLVTMAVLLTR
jgi:polysaccharide biosynthesis/export protein